MPGGTMAGCAPDPAMPPPWAVVQADTPSTASTAKTNPPNFAMRSPLHRKLLHLPVARYGHVRMNGELSGRVAVVTGGASGIGAASAALLADHDARVVVADLQEPGDGAGRFVHSRRRLRAVLAVAVDDVLGAEGRLTSWSTMPASWAAWGAVESTEGRDPGSRCRPSIPKACSWLKYATCGMKQTAPTSPPARASIVNISSIAGLIGGAGPLPTPPAGRGAAAQQERGALLRRAGDTTSAATRSIPAASTRRSSTPCGRRWATSRARRSWARAIRSAAWPNPASSARSCCGSPRTARASSPARRSSPTAQ